MIVLADADLERAANAAVYYSMQNAGQTCISVERVYVEEPVYDEFVARVADKVRALRQGRPERPGSVDVGAITFPPQIDIDRARTSSDAVDKGAQRARRRPRARTGGGRFYEPTVLVDVDHSMKCMTEETFGPTLPIMKVADAEEAIAPRQRLARTASAPRCGRGRRARRGGRAPRSRPAPSASTTRMINYVGARAADGRLEGVGPRLAPRRGRHPQVLRPADDRSSRARAQDATLHMFPYKARTTRLLAGLFKLLYGRGKRD